MYTWETERTISYRVVSYHVVSCRVLSYRTVSCRILSQENVRIICRIVLVTNVSFAIHSKPTNHLFTNLIICFSFLMSIFLSVFINFAKMKKMLRYPFFSSYLFHHAFKRHIFQVWYRH